MSYSGLCQNFGVLIVPKKKQQTVKAEQTNDRSGLSTERFRKSDRLQMALAGTRNRIGASCNVYECQDSIESIAKAHAWALHVCHQQGAPSVYYGNLRPRGSSIATGGVSGGAVPFMHMLDSIVHEIKRDTYKKGAGIGWLPWWHQDLQEFLAADFKSLYRGVLLPHSDNYLGWREFWDSDVSEALVTAYDAGKCFLCKQPAPHPSGKLRFRNLCTEVELVSEDMCVLGVVNLSQYTPDNIRDLPEDFANAATSMLNDSRVAWQIKSQSPLASVNDERQFGLGVSGLASTLANWGVSYTEFTGVLHEVLTNAHPSIEAVAADALELHDSVDRPATQLVAAICAAYERATHVLRGSVVRAFCVQPSATGAYECADASGYHSSPELQPVIGVRDKSGVHTMRKSQLKGDTLVTFHPATETIEDVPYATYALLSSCWQLLMDSTGLAHAHSACFYGREFTKEDLLAFALSPRRNLYYRLPYYNPEAIDKSSVGEGLAIDEDFSLDSLLLGGSCSLQQPGDNECGCTG